MIAVGFEGLSGSRRAFVSCVELGLRTIRVWAYLKVWALGLVNGKWTMTFGFGPNDFCLKFWYPQLPLELMYSAFTDPEDNGSATTLSHWTL